MREPSADTYSNGSYRTLSTAFSDAHPILGRPAIRLGLSIFAACDENCGTAVSAVGSGSLWVPLAA